MAKKTKTKSRAKKTKVAKRGSGGAKLPAKRCPNPGIMVKSRAGLIGVTTGVCEKRRVSVAIMGGGAKSYARGELRKVPKGQQARIKKELGERGATQRASVMNFPKRARSYNELEREALMHSRPASVPMTDTMQSRYMDGY